MAVGGFWGEVTGGALASFAMGANDVANATGSLVDTGTFSPLVAALIGGAALAVGVLTWGRPLLARVAFDIVTVDRPMDTAAQLAGRDGYFPLRPRPGRRGQGGAGGGDRAAVRAAAQLGR